MVEKTFETISEAHEWVVKYLIQEDNQLTTEDSAPTLESEFPVSLIVLHPLKEPMVSPAYLFSNAKLQDYVKQLTNLTPPSDDPKKNFAYTYYNRLADYPVDLDGWQEGNGRGTGINQLRESIIERLAKDPASRRAIAITLVPEIDRASHDPPCMQFVHCLIRKGRLNMIAYFRSNDMMSAWGANAYGLAHLQLMILGAINSAANAKHEMGWLMTTSGSAHLYENDGMQLKEFRKVLRV